jgi:hypothetical protein
MKLVHTLSPSALPAVDVRGQLFNRQNHRCRVAWLCMLLLFIAGCAPNLIDTMRNYGFSPMNPPTTGWEPGTIVEIPSRDQLPAPLLLPSTAGAKAAVLDSNAPMVSDKHDSKTIIGAGISIPDWLAAKIQTNYQNISTYSLVAKGNKLKTVVIIPYYDTFARMLSFGGDNLHRHIDRGNTSYLSALWFADQIEYQFYDSNDAKIQVEIPLEALPVGASAGWQSTNTGSLIYQTGDPICIGYIVRPISKMPSGVIGPLAEREGGPAPTGQVPLPMSWGGLVTIKQREASQ